MSVSVCVCKTLIIKEKGLSARDMGNGRRWKKEKGTWEELE